MTHTASNVQDFYIVAGESTFFPMRTGPFFFCQIKVFYAQGKMIVTYEMWKDHNKELPF